MNAPTEIMITDVALRDGLQNEPKTLALHTKRELAEGLIGSGIRSLEVGSFVNPSRVPQMADTAELFGALPPAEGVEYLALVLNRRSRESVIGTRRFVSACTCTTSAA
jgi:hydroxymethylglutaryl-CoA lyase